MVDEGPQDDYVVDERTPGDDDVIFGRLPLDVEEPRRPSGISYEMPYDEEEPHENAMSGCDSYTMGGAEAFWDAHELTADHLIDNEFANVMLSDDKGGNHALRLEWLRVLQSEYDKNNDWKDRPSLASRASRTSKVSRPSGSNRTSGLKPTSTVRGTEMKSMVWDTAMLVGSSGGRMKPHHIALQRVIKTIFGMDELSMTIKAKSSVDLTQKEAESWDRTLMSSLRFLQRMAFDLVGRTGFVLFSFVLTFYALLAPDIVALLGSKKDDNFFLTLNTVIFFLFIVEVLLMILAHSNRPQDYVLSLPFVLDLLAIIGFLSDTWLLQSKRSSSGNYGDASRMARLPRLARIARATRLIPRLIALFRRDQSSFALMIMLRRLRRAFMVMDVDGTGCLTTFDLKCLYVCILTECTEMLRPNKVQLLLADKDTLKGSPGSDDPDANLRYSDFTRILLRTQLGQDLLQYHTREVLHSKGIFTVTTKLSDAASLRICMGILIISVCTKMMDLEVPQISAVQSLAHLTKFTMREHAAKPMENFGAVCEQVDVYTEDFKVLYLYLDGRVYIDSSVHAINKCMNPVLTSLHNAMGAMAAALQQSGLRESEVVQACWPEVDECPGEGAMSMALIDTQKKVQDSLMWSMISTLTVVLIIILFILFFKREITRFTKRTLHPLRKLVDDMIAIASLELVDIDPDKEDDGYSFSWKRTSSLMRMHKGSKCKCCKRGKREPKVNREVLQLQNSFKGMQNAIRSWSRYVPPSVVQKLFSAGVEATVGVSKVPCTILFVDVIDFEDAVKGMGPKEVNDTLASMLATVAAVVQKNDGTLLEFIGDEVLAVFNTPVVMKAHVLAAVTSALEIHRDMAKLPPILTPDGSMVQLRCRCGVHTAKVLAGNIGSHRRMKYGLLGDGVNLSARLKSINSRYGTQTLASDQIFKDELSVHRAIFRPLDLVILKGKTEPTTLYEIMGFQRPGEGVDPERNKTLVEAAKSHAEAYRLYHNRDFVSAKAKFHQVSATLRSLQHCTVAINARDTPSFEMRRRCKKYIRNPPDESWDGVERLVAKSYVVASDDLSDSEKEQQDTDVLCGDLDKEKTTNTIVSV